jgi:hypothetical protein
LLTPICRVWPRARTSANAANGLGERDGLVRPVDQQKIDVVCPQPRQTLGRPPAHVIAGKVGVSKLRGQEDRRTIDPGFGDGLPDLRLVLIADRGI